MSTITIYQVLPRLFGNDCGRNIPSGSIAENGCGKLSAFTPKALQKIKEMGVSHIWFTGVLEHATQSDYSAYGIAKDHPAIVKGKAGSPYSIKDYYDICPDLADCVENRMQEFEDLVKRTHEADMKVIIDFVPNHVARQYHSDACPQGTSDLGENDDVGTTFARDNNFYYIPGQTFSPHFSLEVDGEIYREYPAKATGNDCFHASPSRNDWYETVKLNYGIDYLGGWQTYFDPIPDTWKKMCDILLFWAAKSVDGFRCDMAEMTPTAFWAYAIPHVKERFPNVIFIAEVYNPAQYRDYLHAGKFDYLYDKVGLYDTLRAIVCGDQSANAITHCWQSLNDIQPQMLNFLENHDEQRIASDFFAGDPRKALPALVVSALMNTNPFMFYFGQELGESGMDEEGFSGRDGRTTIFDYWQIASVANWRNKGSFDGASLTEEQKSLRKYYMQISRLRNESLAIREGLFYDLMYANHHAQFNADRQYAFLRCHENELLLIVANFDSYDADIQVFIPEHAFEYFSITQATLKPLKDYLSGKKITTEMQRDAFYPVKVKAHDAAILVFSRFAPLR